MRPILATAALALLITACGGSAASPPAPTRAGAAPRAYHPVALNPPVKITVGELGTLSDAGTYIAMDRGYFKDEGLDVETSHFQSLVNMVAPLGAGQLDVGGGAPSAGIYNAIGRGIPLPMVADKGSAIGREWDYAAVMVRKDLMDDNKIHSLADFKGRTISITGKGSISEMHVTEIAKQGGFGLNELKYVELSYADAITALKNKAIDAAIAVEPFVTQMQSQGIAVRWKGEWELFGNQDYGVIVYGQKMRQNPDLGKRWLIAYLRGVRDYNDALGPKKQGRDAIIPILINHTSLKDRALYETITPAGVDPDGKIDLPSLQKQLEFYIQAGEVQGTPDVAASVDTSFAQAAVQVLGPYQQ